MRRVHPSWCVKEQRTVFRSCWSDLHFDAHLEYECRGLKKKVPQALGYHLLNWEAKVPWCVTASLQIKHKCISNVQLRSVAGAFPGDLFLTGHCDKCQAHHLVFASTLQTFLLRFVFELWLSGFKNK